MKIYFLKDLIRDGKVHKAGSTIEVDSSVALQWVRRGCILVEENKEEVANVELDKDIQPKKRFKGSSRIA